MAFRNTSMEYGSVAKFFHWLIFLLVFVLLLVGTFMDDLPDGDLKMFVYTMHKSSGLVVLMLMLLRALWAMNNPKPILLDVKPWERIAEQTVHIGLYVLLIAMPLSGWIMSTAAGHSPVFYGLFTLPMPGIPESKVIAKFFHKTHTYLAYTIVAFLLIHIGAALKHHYIDKDNVLKRMMPGGKID